MVNTILSYSRLCKGFWGVAMLTACHIFNWVLSKTNKKTLFDFWYKWKLNLSYLKVWSAIVRLHGNKRNKLSEQEIVCIFIGYANRTKFIYVTFDNRV